MSKLYSQCVNGKQLIVENNDQGSKSNCVAYYQAYQNPGPQTWLLGPRENYHAGNYKASSSQLCSQCNSCCQVSIDTGIAVNTWSAHCDTGPQGLQPQCNEVCKEGGSVQLCSQCKSCCKSLDEGMICNASSCCKTCKEGNLPSWCDPNAPASAS